MRLLYIALLALAVAGCAGTKTDGKTMATPKKKTALFSCPCTGPCLATAKPPAGGQ